MEDLNDGILAQRTRKGDGQAFVTLVRRYERSLAALIRDRLGSAAVEDVLQETLVHAWTGLRKRTPRKVRAWLYQVARNRCADFLRSTQRRELFVDSETLATAVNRSGVADERQRQAARDVEDAFESVPEREREALKSFYIEGLSIAEIAARHRCPTGTVRRRLSHGRDRVRSELGVTVRRRSRMVDTESQGEKTPFPKYRPEISIVRMADKAETIDLRELTWWFVMPEIGDRVRWCDYEPPLDGRSPWRLARTNDMVARRRAIIHGREGVEIEIEQQELERDGLIPANYRPEERFRDTKVWGRVTETEVEWLAVERMQPDGTRELYTFLDDGFASDFGSWDRVVEDKGYLAERADGTCERKADAPEVFSAGMFTVKFGERTFECTRVFSMEKVASERDVMVLAYVTNEGRTVLFRRYNSNLWGKRDSPPHNQGQKPTWMEDLPHTDRLLIDGVTYVHNYDCLTDLSCGIRD